jgi:hypothetical protein
VGEKTEITGKEIDDQNGLKEKSCHIRSSFGCEGIVCVCVCVWVGWPSLRRLDQAVRIIAARLFTPDRQTYHQGTCHIRHSALAESNRVGRQRSAKHDDHRRSTGVATRMKIPSRRIHTQIHTHDENFTGDLPTCVYAQIYPTTYTVYT